MTLLLVGPPPAPPPSPRSAPLVTPYKYVRHSGGCASRPRVWVGVACSGVSTSGCTTPKPPPPRPSANGSAPAADPTAGLPGVLQKWVTPNPAGTFDAFARFAGRTIRVRHRPDRGCAYRAAAAAVARIRAADGWLLAPLPTGVVVRADGYRLRYWSGGVLRVVAGPFPTPAAAVVWRVSGGV